MRIHHQSKCRAAVATRTSLRAAQAEPRWFTAALSSPVDTGEVAVLGTTIRYRSWGRRKDPPLVLVHGGGAHARWWDHVAPWLSVDHCVTALDLSGHGDSDKRVGYSMEAWAEEVIAVADVARGLVPPVIVGHSFGGSVAWAAARRHGTALAGVIAIDSLLGPASAERVAARQLRSKVPLRVYPDRCTALAHFRLVPDQDVVLPYVVDHIAQTSLRAVTSGWSWKFDPKIYARPATSGAVAHPGCRAVLLRADHGLLPLDSMTVRAAKRAGIAVLDIPSAGHHVMLDRPVELVSEIRRTLATWAHGAEPIG